MSIEAANAAAVRAFIEDVWNAPDGADRLGDHLCAEYRDHAYGLGGAQGLARAVGELRRAFPEARFEIEDLIAQGDKVAVRLTLRARHQGEFRGIAPTGAAVEAKAFRWFRLTEGRITDHWAVFDTAALLRQLQGG
jgi:predicted ester cyclase